MSTAPTVNATDFARRVIPPSAFVADTSAFVDVRLPRSAGKASYSMIGPGVSQNPDQTVNLVEPHGFHIGAASMPHGVVNNPHLHFTAEVFICTRGRWRIDVGPAAEQSLEIGAGTVFSAPPWVFRGFENIGDDDGWLFVVLGRDETGGIIWAPEVLRRAAETGLYLTAEHTVVESANGAAPDDVLAPIGAAELAATDRYTDDQLEARAVRPEKLVWAERPLLSGAVPGHEVAIAPVLGYGMAEDRHCRPLLTDPHSFSIEWLRLPPGASTATFRMPDSQVLIPTEGAAEIVLNRGDEAHTTDLPTESVVSVPAGTWRELRNGGAEPCTMLVVNGGTHPNTVEWAPEVVEAARRHGVARDANGSLAPAHLLRAEVAS